MRRLLTLLLAVSFVAGCGDDSASETTTGAETQPHAASAPPVAYFLHDGKVWPVSVGADDVNDTEGILNELFAGTRRPDAEDMGLETALPADLKPPDVTMEGDVAKVTLGTELSREAMAQLVYTLTQAPTTKAVEIDGTRYTRGDFEEQTPTVLVESPLPWQEATAPLHVTGTANTYEATFEYELLDADGNVLDTNFVTATSGTGTRGTFDFTTKAVDGVATLVVYETSAEDGSRIHEVEIPLQPAS